MIILSDFEDQKPPSVQFYRTGSKKLTIIRPGLSPDIDNPGNGE